ncbi:MULTISPECIES: hypothetical protein [Paenibacillus]|uniref:hypothetical protein n=1 Tax=Paenibacillus TaxID=44249 RepID=UPI000ABF264D|nr:MULTISPECIES: hypothetical protein [Paenibacillus]MDU4694650.1 hypothetical protein [Paenibacillus sp.]
MAKADFVPVQSLIGSQLNVLRYWQLQQDFFQAIDRLVQELEPVGVALFHFRINDHPYVSPDLF